MKTSPVTGYWFPVPSSSLARGRTLRSSRAPSAAPLGRRRGHPLLRLELLCRDSFRKGRRRAVGRRTKKAFDRGGDPRGLGPRIGVRDSDPSSGPVSSPRGQKRRPYRVRPGGIPLLGFGPLERLWARKSTFWLPAGNQSRVCLARYVTLPGFSPLLGCYSSRDRAAERAGRNACGGRSSGHCRGRSMGLFRGRWPSCRYAACARRQPASGRCPPSGSVRSPRPVSHRNSAH
jgi:hypothetical protein